MVAKRILDAAETHFAHYGYRKTTMADIARACGMSVGNLYRHFKSKSDIAAAVVERFLMRKLLAGTAAARKEQGAAEKLSAFLLERLRVSHHHIHNFRHVHDLVEAVDEQHPEMLQAMEKKVIEAIRGFILEGIRSGCFRPLDPERTAYLLHQSMLRYNHPISLKRNDLATLERDLRDYLDLLYSGLCKANQDVQLKEVNP